MIPNQFSRTARGAALHRAAHQVFEKGAIFSDPFACAIMGLTPEEVVAEAANDQSERRLRLFIAVRARFAEDRLAEAVARGVRQAVILGAGLDTFALRNPHAKEGVRVFEVDHPDTQRWKRERLAALGVDALKAPSFAPVDFERDDLWAQLQAAGFDAGLPAFFVWLGVTPYLSPETTLATLAMIARTPGAEVAFDYVEPREQIDDEPAALRDALAARVAALGEPLVGAFAPHDLAQDLVARGLTEQEDLDIPAIRLRYFGAPRESARRASVAHLMWARRPG